MKKFGEITSAECDEIFDFVQQKTGAASLVLILNNTVIPCSTVIAGFGCIGDHDIIVAERGIKHSFLFGVLMARALDIGEQHGMTKESMLESAQEMMDMKDADDARKEKEK